MHSSLSIAGTLSPQPLSSVFQLQLLAGRPPCIHTHTYTQRKPQTQEKLEKEFNERTGQTVLIRHRVLSSMTIPCLHVTSPFIPLSLYPSLLLLILPLNTLIPLSTFGCFPKHSILNLCTTSRYSSLHPMRNPIPPGCIHP